MPLGATPTVFDGQLEAGCVLLPIGLVLQPSGCNIPYPLASLARRAIVSQGQTATPSIGDSINCDIEFYSEIPLVHHRIISTFSGFVSKYDTV